jgi:hypothetical protein
VRNTRIDETFGQKVLAKGTAVGDPDPNKNRSEANVPADHWGKHAVTLLLILAVIMKGHAQSGDRPACLEISQDRHAGGSCGEVLESMPA